MYMEDSHRVSEQMNTNLEFLNNCFTGQVNQFHVIHSKSWETDDAQETCICFLQRGSEEIAAKCENIEEQARYK